MSLREGWKSRSDFPPSVRLRLESPLTSQRCATCALAARHFLYQIKILWLFNLLYDSGRDSAKLISSNVNAYSIPIFNLVSLECSFPQTYSAVLCTLRVSKIDGFSTVGVSTLFSSFSRFPSSLVHRVEGRRREESLLFLSKGLGIGVEVLFAVLDLARRLFALPLSLSSSLSSFSFAPFFFFFSHF